MTLNVYGIRHRGTNVNHWLVGSERLRVSVIIRGMPPSWRQEHARIVPMADMCYEPIIWAMSPCEPIGLCLAPYMHQYWLIFVPYTSTHYWGDVRYNINKTTTKTTITTTTTSGGIPCVIHMKALCTQEHLSASNLPYHFHHIVSKVCDNRIISSVTN